MLESELTLKNKSRQFILMGLLALLLIVGSGLEVKAQPAVPAEAMAAAQSRAVQQILVSARSADPVLRANALEAAEALPRRIGPLVQQAMNDPQPVVRYAALVTIGKLKLAGVAPGARAFLQDPNESVRAAAIFALARNFGSDPQANPMAVDISPLGGFVFSSNPATRANVAYLMGYMGDPSAIALLKDGARKKLHTATPARMLLVRLQIAEAIYKLGNIETLDSIRAGMFSQFDEVRILSVQILGRLFDRQWESAVENALKRPPIELQLAAAGTLARFGNRKGLNLMLDAAQSGSTLLRSQAAIMLGMFRNEPQATQMLMGLLTDQSESVRLAAAAGLLGGGRDGL